MSLRKSHIIFPYYFLLVLIFVGDFVYFLHIIMLPFSTKKASAFWERFGNNKKEIDLKEY